MTEEKLLNEKQDSIKLTKTTKGYTWEIKLYNNAEADKTLAEIDRINEQLKKNYGDTQ